jgi:cation diffusion facilitator family transporter
MRKPQCQTFCATYYAWISYVSNVFNAALKIGVGIVTHSQALVADGFHSLSDSFTALVTIAALRFSSKPSDDRHPYGHGKIEFLSAAFFSLILIALSLWIMGRAIFAIVKGAIEPPNFLAIGPAFVSILSNIAISNYGLCVGKELNSPVVMANAQENRADAYSSIASLVGITGAIAGYAILDPLAAIAVSLLIGHMGCKIFGEAGAGLMDASIGENQRKEIRRAVLSVPGVDKIAYLRTRRTGQRTWADVGIVVPSVISLYEGDAVAQEVRNSLMRNFPQMQDCVVYLGNDQPAGRKKQGLLGAIASLLRRRNAE